MSRIGSIAFLSASVLAFDASGQSTPGQINDPGTYKGSMALQEQERANSAAQQQANQAMLNSLDQNYKQYAPRGGGGGRGSAPTLKQKPLLPASRNPLLGGLWRMGETKAVNLGNNPVLELGRPVVDAAFGGGCANVLGKPDTVVRFTATTFDWVAPDGHAETLNHVEYRGDANNVIVIPTDSDLPLIFGLPDKDSAVVAFLGCTLHRTSTPQRLATAAASRGGTGVAGAAGLAPNAGGVKGAAGKARLAMKVGETVDGQFSAPPSVRLWLTPQDPDANLARAGFSPEPIERLFDACRIGQGGTQQRCSQGMQALTAGAIADLTTDANGNAAAEGIAPGRYYVVGFTPYKGHSLVWHLPVDVHPGFNNVSLTPQNGTISH